MTIDALVVRHKCSGVPQMLADATKASVINAGDGAHEHPTQGSSISSPSGNTKGRSKA